MPTTEQLFQRFIADNFEDVELTAEDTEFIRLIFSAGAIMATLMSADQIHDEFRDLAALIKAKRNLRN